VRTDHTQKYLELLDQSNVMREADGLGYLTSQKQHAIGTHVRGPFRINCCRLVYEVVREGSSFQGVITRVSDDIDSILRDMKRNGIVKADPDDCEYLKEALFPLIKKQWERSPLGRAMFGTLDKHPQLAGLAVPVVVGLGALLWAQYTK
jgi:hypothetical protein